MSEAEGSMRTGESELPEDLRQLIHELRDARRTAGELSAGLLIRVRDLAHRHLKPEDRLRLVMDSEDLAQDTLLDLVRVVDEFRGTSWSEFLAFATALLRRRKVDRARHHRARPGDLDPRDPLAGQATVNVSTRTPSAALGDREDAEHLQALVAALPSTYREPLRLRLDGLSYYEIAERTGVTCQNARQRISRALRKLRDRW